MRARTRALFRRRGRFGEIEQILHAMNRDHVDGIMLDLGVSSFQIDEAGRGFSFMRDGPLDMRMEKRGPSAADAVNHLTEGELADIIHILGEEHAARRIAREIVHRRRSQPFTTTLDLADVVEKALGGRRGKPTHPATRTFQALRMWVNDESGELVRALAAAERVLKPGGRLVIVTFHSIEDRIVKLFLRSRSGNDPGVSRHLPKMAKGKAPTFEVLQRKAIEPSEAETASNPRARSARLRWALRTEAPAWNVDADDGFRLPGLKQLEGVCLMKRLAIIGGLVVAVLAVAVYRAKLSAEETQVRIDELKIEAQAEEAAIASLRADEAVLTRPERIGGIAQQQLGLEPANPSQYVAPEALKQRLGEERLRLPAPAQPAEAGAQPQQQ